MNENKYPPGYVPLTIHELTAQAARSGKKNSGLDPFASLYPPDESFPSAVQSRSNGGHRARNGGGHQYGGNGRRDGGGGRRHGKGGGGGRHRGQQHRRDDLPADDGEE